jgi:nucleoside-diphosphate-sugar epimerase
VKDVVEVAVASWNAVKVSTSNVNLGEIDNNAIESKELNLDSNLATQNIGWEPRFSQKEAIISTIKWWESLCLKQIPASVLIQIDIAEFLSKYK